MTICPLCNKMEAFYQCDQCDTYVCIDCIVFDNETDLYNNAIDDMIVQWCERCRNE